MNKLKKTTVLLCLLFAVLIAPAQKVVKKYIQKYDNLAKMLKTFRTSFIFFVSRFIAHFFLRVPVFAFNPKEIIQGFANEAFSGCTFNDADAKNDTCWNLMFFCLFQGQVIILFNVAFDGFLGSSYGR